MKNALRILGTVAALIAEAGHVSAALRAGDDTSGWRVLAVTVGVAVVLLALWWPHRKEHDR